LTRVVVYLCLVEEERVGAQIPLTVTMKIETNIGVNLRGTAHSNQGGRKYMEDMFCVANQPTADDRDLLFAYFGIFDGHGGR
jgi:hypothetical protein